MICLLHLEAVPFFSEKVMALTFTPESVVANLVRRISCATGGGAELRMSYRARCGRQASQQTITVAVH
jgi:hypothetical protein